MKKTILTLDQFLEKLLALKNEIGGESKVLLSHNQNADPAFYVEDIVSKQVCIGMMKPKNKRKKTTKLCFEEIPSALIIPGRIYSPLDDIANAEEDK